MRHMRNILMFLKLKNPRCPVLHSYTNDVFGRYVEHVIGKDICNFTIVKDGKTVSCAHNGPIMDYDYAMRTKWAEAMSNGTDIETAIEEANADKDLRLSSFLAPFTCDAATSE